MYKETSWTFKREEKEFQREDIGEAEKKNVFATHSGGKKKSSVGQSGKNFLSSSV